MAGAAPSPPAAPLDAEALAGLLGHSFTRPELLLTALRHRSWVAEHGGESNERLEFLGDAVLDLVVSAELFTRYPDLPEGRLSVARSAVVSTEGLAPVAAALGLGGAILLGRGEEQSGGREKPSLLENAFEAVIGAVFLDGGLDAARRVALAHLGDVLDEAAASPGRDFKTRLQEWAAHHEEAVPRYELRGEGPDHARVFHAQVLIGDRSCGHGTGRSKKQAEQAAARAAWNLLVAPVPGPAPAADPDRKRNEASHA